MKSLDVSGKNLQDVVEELSNIYYPLSEKKTALIEANKYLQKSNDENLIIEVVTQRLKAELRKYLSRPEIYSEQIEYIKKKIEDIEKGNI